MDGLISRRLRLLCLLLVCSCLFLTAQKPVLQHSNADPEQHAQPVAKPSSGISHIKIDKDRLAHLEVLGWVWGFLKYYHPAVAANVYDWDEQLFLILPQVLDAENALVRDEILLNWIDTLAQARPRPAPPAKTPTDLFAPAHLEWLDQEELDPALVSRLRSLQENYTAPLSHPYVSMTQIGNPDFKGEEPYPSLDYPDAGFRLLAAYRYWNIIQYFFPYRHLTERDWYTILPKYISRLVTAKDALDYRLALIEMIGQVYDTHANLWGNDSLVQHYWGSLSSPVAVQFVGDTLVVSDYIDPVKGPASGLQIGDAITAIDDQPVLHWVRDHRHQFPASNEPTRRRDMARKILKGSEPEARLTVFREGETHTINMQRYPAHALDRTAYIAQFRPASSYRWLKEDVGYITLASIQVDSLATIFATFQDAKGLVIDMRNYPQEFVVFHLGKYLMPKPHPFVRFTTPTLASPGDLVWTTELYVGEDNPDYFKGKVVLLLDESSQSQAEYTAMAFRQAPQATVLGSTTAGADGNVSRIMLPGGLMTMISGIGVYYPDGTETQRVGIVPDEWMVPSRAGIKAGRDELLERAIEIIEKQ